MPSSLPSANRSVSAVLFASAAKERLQTLQTLHITHLRDGDDGALRQTANDAVILKRAVVVHDALEEILLQSDPSTSKDQNQNIDNNKQRSSSTQIPAVTDESLPSPPLPDDKNDNDSPERIYLRGAATRMKAALHDNDMRSLQALCASVQTVLDGDHLFPDPVDDNTPQQSEFKRRKTFFSVGPFGGTNRDGMNDLNEEANDQQTSSSGWCGFLRDLTPKDKTVIGLYLIMVLLALAAVTAVTIDFIKQSTNPGSFIRSDPLDSLPAPVVTTCIAQPGVPFSRLQLFNFTDAEGISHRGGDPQGEHKKRTSKEFEDVVERFWENPGNEDCDRLVGDFFPFPVKSLNDIVSGRLKTRCRACYRVGRKKVVQVRSTRFENSSNLFFYTDNYWLKCMHSKGGPDEQSTNHMQDQLYANRKNLTVDWRILQTRGEPGVDNIDLDAYRKLTPEMACNLIYFGLFPLQLKKERGADVRYEYDGTNWNEIGDGPYFRVRKELKEFIPEESLQFFVETNRTAKKHGLNEDRDMILIGPNTQTLATLRPVNVYGQDRFDISSSTSNLRDSDVTALFGFWLVYKIYYNYNRFVIDEYYRESTYPASQWIVDLTGYASLFTGASLFSLLLLPLLRSMRRRESRRLKRYRPEQYVWAKHRKKIGEAPIVHTDLEVGGGNDDAHKNRAPVLLPGYNV